MAAACEGRELRLEKEEEGGDKRERAICSFSLCREREDEDEREII